MAESGGSDDLKVPLLNVPIQSTIEVSVTRVCQTILGLSPLTRPLATKSQQSSMITIDVLTAIQVDSVNLAMGMSFAEKRQKSIPPAHSPGYRHSDEPHHLVCDCKTTNDERNLVQLVREWWFGRCTCVSLWAPAQLERERT